MAPERSLEQRRAALVKANEIRTKRSHLKRDLRAGKPGGLDKLINPPDWLETMKVINFLLALPKVGRVKALKHLNHCQIAASKTIGGLSVRQRKSLREALR